jgi:hypothetical protein
LSCAGHIPDYVIQDALIVNLADELLAIAADKEIPRLDEKLFLETFQQPIRKKPAVQGTKR